MNQTSAISVVMVCAKAVKGVTMVTSSQGTVATKIVELNKPTSVPLRRINLTHVSVLVEMERRKRKEMKYVTTVIKSMAMDALRFAKLRWVSFVKVELRQLLTRALQYAAMASD